MKKFLMTMVVAIIAAVMPQQSKAVDLNISYGGYTAMDACGGYGGHGTAWGALTAAAYFKTLPKLDLGVSYTFSSNDHVYYHVALVNAKYQYFKNSIVKVYAHVGLGPEFTHYENWDTKGHFGFQISPVGATVDLAPNVGIFGELGFGCQGLLQAGVKFSF